MNLIDESPEAQEFFRDVASDIEKHKRFQGERFAKILTGVLATSAVDSQNEAIAPESLEDMATQITRDSLWMMVEHNPLIGPVGRVLAARRFYAPQSDLYFVATVSGVYDIDHIPTFEDAGADLSATPAEDAYQPVEEEWVPTAQIAYNPHEISEGLVEEMLQQAPDFVARDVAMQVRKSAEPLPILTVVVSLWLLSTNPFLKKYQERLGERSADATVALMSWLKDKVFNGFSHLSPKALFVLESPYKGCKVEFVVASTQPAVLVEATDTVHLAAKSAMLLIDQLERLGVEKLVYEYNLAVKMWLPLHAATREAGVIRNRRALIAFDQLEAKKQRWGKVDRFS